MIFLIGFLLRFYWLHAGHAYHYLAINDEITAYGYAMRFLAGDSATYYLGQPNFGGGNVPGPYFSLYWVTAFQLGGKSVEGALFVVLLFNSAVIALIYRLALYFHDNQHALLTSLLFATAPWTVYYAIGLWNPMPLVILGALLFISLWRTVHTDNSRSIFWVWIILAIIPHFHMIGLFYVPAVLLVLYALPTRLNRRWFVVGILAGITLYLPYLIGDGLHDWQNTRAIFAGEGKDSFSFSALKILTAPVAVLSNLPSRWNGPEFASYIAYGDHYFGSYIVLLIINLASVFFSLYVVYSFLGRFFRLWRTHRFSIRCAFAAKRDMAFIGLMVFVPLLMFLPTGHNYATRYTIIIFPLLFILLTRGIQGLYPSRLGGIVKVAVFFTVLFNSYLCLTFFNHTGNMLEAEKKFMPSFRKLEEIQKILAKTVDGTPTITLAKNTSTLSELDRALLAALPAYIDIHYRFIEKDSGKIPIPLQLSQDRADTSDIKQQDIVYRANGIILSRHLNQTSP